MTPLLSLLGPEDAEAAHTLHKTCFAPEDTWSTEAFRETLSLVSTRGLAGRADDGSLTGMIIVQRTPPDAEILTLAVAPARRRAGLASALLSGLKPLLGPYGTGRLLLEVAADNPDAINFYEHSGFREDGRRKNYYPRRKGRPVDAIMMSRPVAGHTEESEA